MHGSQRCLITVINRHVHRRAHMPFSSKSALLKCLFTFVTELNAFEIVETHPKKSTFPFKGLCMLQRPFFGGVNNPFNDGIFEFL